MAPGEARGVLCRVIRGELGFGPGYKSSWRTFIMGMSSGELTEWTRVAIGLKDVDGDGSSGNISESLGERDTRIIALAGFFFSSGRK